MDWKEWVGKKIFVQLKSGGYYSGVVEYVDDSNPTFVFIFMTDKYGKKVTFVHSEILKIVEEEE